MSDQQANALMLCTACGYDLQGLVQHRCPECGRAFDPNNLKSFRHKVVNGEPWLAGACLGWVIAIAPFVGNAENSIVCFAYVLQMLVFGRAVHALTRRHVHLPHRWTMRAAAWISGLFVLIPILVQIVLILNSKV